MPTGTEGQPLAGTALGSLPGEGACTPVLPEALSLQWASALPRIPQGRAERGQEGRDPPWTSWFVRALIPPLARLQCGEEAFLRLGCQQRAEFKSASGPPCWPSLYIHFFSLHTCPGLCFSQDSCPECSPMVTSLPPPPHSSLTYTPRVHEPSPAWGIF